MRALDRTATAVFNLLTQGLTQPGMARKFDRGGKGTGIMAVSVDFLRRDTVKGAVVEMWAVAHRYEQNGDLVPDPDVEFCVVRADTADVGEEKICPTQIEHLGRLFRHVYFDDGPLPTRIHRRGQADLTVFCNQWMRNLKLQQGL